ATPARARSGSRRARRPGRSDRVGDVAHGYGSGVAFSARPGRPPGRGRGRPSMTDLLMRSDTAAPLPDRPAPAPPEFTLGTEARWTVAALAAGAGVVHLAMVPSHWSGSAWEGFAFAVCGWLQLALAVLVLVRPTRALLWGGVALNAAAIAVWPNKSFVGVTTV